MGGIREKRKKKKCDGWGKWVVRFRRYGEMVVTRRVRLKRD